MQSQNRFFTILILGALVALGPFSIDMYLPGLPEIAKDFGVSTGTATISLSSFFIGISAGQLLYGPLYDRFGRKKPLIIGLIAYIVASLLCALSFNVEMLIGMRFLQAVGGCAAGVAATVLVRDLFPVNDSAKIFALLMLVLGTSPMVAPTVGGYVTKALGWEAVFIILSLMGVSMLVAVIFALPNVYVPNTSLSLKPKPILSGFVTVLKVPQFYTYSLCGSISFAGLFAYISTSPTIFMEIFKVSAEVYGWIFALLSVGFIGASQINSFLLRKFKSQQIVPVALVIQVLASLLFFMVTYFFAVNQYIVIAFIFGYLACLGFVAPNTSALTMAPFSKNAGSASSLMGSLQMSLGGIISIAMGLIKLHSAMPLALVMSIASIVALLILLVFKGRIDSPGGNV